MHGKITTIFILFVLGKLAKVNSFQLKKLDYIGDLEMDNNYDGESDPLTKHCIDKYPYTYSKCLQICSSNLNSTCLDDQLCYCSSNELIMNESESKEKHSAASLNDFLGTKRVVSCLFSDFCQDLCKYDGTLKEFLKDELEVQGVVGALCNYETDDLNITEACVCKI